MKRLLLTLALAACSDDDGGTPALFPDNYASTYQEVRNCRNSNEHNLRRVRVLASPEAQQPYTTRAEPFPIGAIVLKVEYDDNDPTCAGDPIGFTVMKKGGTAAELDWTWQELDGDKQAVDTPTAKCVNCHEDCGKAPDGYDGTCTLP